MKPLHILLLLLCIPLDARMLLPLAPRADVDKFYFVDYFRPQKKDGSDYPCSGHVDHPPNTTAQLRAGHEYELQLFVDLPRYDGGSCQLALSYDHGETFKVIKSIVGDCMIPPTYRFTVPVDAPTGKALVAMTHFNRRQTQDMFMSCAPVTVANDGPPLGASNGTQPQQNVAFESLPNLFIANIDQLSPCKTFEGVDLVFPHPGPDVEYASDDLKSTGESGYSCSSSPSSSDTASCPPVCTFTVVFAVTFDKETPTLETSYVTSKSVTAAFQTSPGDAARTSSPLSQSGAPLTDVTSGTTTVPSSHTAERCAPGAIRCDSDTKFSLCSEEGVYLSMGSLRLPANAQCIDGEIIFDG